MRALFAGPRAPRRQDATLPSARLLALVLALVLAVVGEAFAGPQPVPEADLHAVRVAGTGSGSDDEASNEDDDDDAPPPFEIEDSDTDLNTYAMDCFQLRDTFMDWRIEAYASTVANRSAYYLAVDVKLYTNGVLRKQKFEDRYGPISAISTSVTYTAPCHEYEEASPVARGWHKGIDERGDGPVYHRSSDR